MIGSSKVQKNSLLQIFAVRNLPDPILFGTISLGFAAVGLSLLNRNYVILALVSWHLWLL